MTGGLRPDDRARRQRCRMLELAGAFGVLFAAFSAVGRAWIPVAVGVVGVAVVAVVHRRRCRGLEDDP
jgi:hypothetical protein